MKSQGIFIISFLFSGLLFGCNNKKQDPIEKIGREALKETFEPLKKANHASKNSVKTISYLIMSKDPFKAMTALTRVKAWTWEQSRPIYLKALSAPLSMVRDKAALLLMKGETNTGAPENFTWSESLNILLNKFLNGFVSEDLMPKFAKLISTEHHETIRNAIILAKKPIKLKGYKILCMLDLNDKDIKFLLRHGPEISDKKIFDECDYKIQKATFGKKSLGRGIR